MDYDLQISKFEASLQTSYESKICYRRNLKQWFEWLDSEYITDPDHSHILHFKDNLINKSLSPRTIANYLTSIRLFYRWLEQERLGRNIAKNIKLNHSAARGFNKDALDLNQVLKLLQTVDKESNEGLRDFALLNLMIRVGLRTIEIVRANIGDIANKDGKKILWVQGKGRSSKDEFIVLTDESYEPIQNYLSQRQNIKSSMPLFASLSPRNLDQRLTTRSIRRIIKKYLRSIDLDSPRISSHSLRHTAITLALKAGAPIRQVQGMARHKSVTTTEIYAHDIDRLHNSAEEKISLILPDIDKAS